MAAKDLIDFNVRGKMIRGQLTVFTSGLFNRRVQTQALAAGAALEILHGSLLIHDDIIDEDRLRRGKPSLHAAYASRAVGWKVRNPPKFGSDMGICVGDIGFFLSYELLSVSGIPDSKKIRIFEVIGRELSAVGLGQMLDVYHGEIDQVPDETEILNCYRYKTARYTFGLPFAVGAIISGQDDAVIEKLWSLGEHIGFIFQIRDDELGIFGNSSISGKPVGSDISMNKKTLYLAHLNALLAGDERKHILSLFGKKDLSETEIAKIRTAIKKYGIDSIIARTVEGHRLDGERIIRSLGIPDSYKDDLRWLMEYVKKRDT
jgi:geranylgeranyl diphosphate synthase type I